MAGSAPARPVPLLAYVHTVPWDVLPRFAEVTSGVYIGGSIYDMGGSEITLSNGDVIRITDIKLDKVLAKVVSTDSKECVMPRGIIMEVPADYAGLFQIEPSKRKYATFEDIADSYKLARHGGWQLAFHASVEIRAGDATVPAGERLVPLCVTGEGPAEARVRWRRERRGSAAAAAATLLLPLRFKGDFYEARDGGHYTLREVVRWRLLPDGTRTVRPLTSLRGVQHLHADFQGLLKLTASTSVVGFVNDALGQIVLPSNLDVEVRDVTEAFRDKKFVVPVTAAAIFKYPADRFPLSVKVLEAERSYSACPKVKFEAGARLTIHRAEEVRKAMVTRERLPLPPQSFLVPLRYRGLLTKRPRVFCSTFDIDAAWGSGADQLEVRATTEYEADHPELASLASGDRLVVQAREVLRVKAGCWYEELETLRCLRATSSSASSASASASAGAVIHLPLYVQSSFVEVVNEKRRLSLAQVVQEGPVPVNVKVVAGDPLLADDPLAPSSITVEGCFDDPCLIVSREGAAGCFELPVDRVHMKVNVLEGCRALPAPPPPHANLEKVPSYFLSKLKGTAKSTNKGRPPVPYKFSKDGAVCKEIKKVPLGKEGQSTKKEFQTLVIPEQTPSVKSPTPARKDKGGDVSDSDGDYDDVSEEVAEPRVRDESTDSEGIYEDIGLASETRDFLLAQEAAAGKAKEDAPEDGDRAHAANLRQDSAAQAAQAAQAAAASGVSPVPRAHTSRKV